MTAQAFANSIMQAAVFHGHERITIERVAMPDVAKGEVLVRVSRTALCGSDFKLWHKGAAFTAGHEICGVVEQPGHPMHGKRCRSTSPSIATIAQPANVAIPRCVWRSPA